MGSLNNDYEKIKKQIEKDLEGSKCLIETNDSNLITSIKNENEDGDPEYDKRNTLYTDLLYYYIKMYKSKSKHKSIYKMIFFVVVMSGFCVIIVSSLISINNISLKYETSLSDFGVIIGSFAGILSSIMVIPKIIAEHLFPNDEDTTMIDMVKNMQLNDTKIRNWLNGRKNKKI